MASFAPAPALAPGLARPISSPSSTAVQTAAPVADALGLTVEIDDRIAEYDRALPQYVPIEQIAAAKRAQLASDLAGVATTAERVGDVDLYAFQAPDDLDGGALRDLALATRGKAGQERAAVVLALSVLAEIVGAYEALHPHG